MNVPAGKLARLLLVLWAGSLWALAAWIAPLVFHLAPNRRIAGLIAAGLFEVETYLTALVAAVALWRCGARRCRPIYLAAALLLFNEWGVKRLLERTRGGAAFAGVSFAGWHGLSALLYALACAAALCVIWKDEFR